jgi:D-xylose transport system ATP-binding protein
LLRGKELHVANPREALRSGIAYLPADRKREGLIPRMSVAENMSLAALGRFTTLGGAVDRSAELGAVQQYISSLSVKCDSADQNVMQLSGGNQQKIVAAKWLLVNPDILVFEEPTRGVDVNARIDLYNLINDVTASGKSVILLSTDLPEVLGMADRILVMCGGTITGEWQRAEASEESVMLCAAGGHA